MKQLAHIARRLAVASAIAMTSVSAFATPINAVDNSGFESPAQGTGYTYIYNTTVGDWTFSGNNVGYAGNNSGFNVSNAAGNNAAFIQIGGSSISQAFNFAASQFAVTFLAEGRSGYGANSISVLVDGIALTFAGASALIPGTSATFTSYTSDFVQLSYGLHTLSFVGNGVNGRDVTTFIDNVSINAVPEPVTLGLFGLGLLAMGATCRKSKPSA